MNANELLERLRRLADVRGDQAKEWGRLNHPHLSSWHQGHREAYLHVIQMLDSGDPDFDATRYYRDLGGEG